jgi:mono/diheme cytochrome c family protein
MNYFSSKEFSMKKISKTILIIGIVLLALFLVIQLVPFGKDHSNPAVKSEPAWDSADTRALAKRACFDCHSNETIWPWYSKIAPVSWLVAADVEEGRAQMNFSDWNRGRQPSTSEIIGELEEGGMPPFQYPLMHPEAKLTAAEKQALIDGFRATLP